VDYAARLGFLVKLLAVADHVGQAEDGAQQLDARVQSRPVAQAPSPGRGPWGERRRSWWRVIRWGPGDVLTDPALGLGPRLRPSSQTILNIAGIRQVGGAQAGLDPLLAASSWNRCRLVDGLGSLHRNYLRLLTRDEAGVIGLIGTSFGDAGVSIQSIVQYETDAPGPRSW
jgi:homoserine dehydrogenase